MGCTNGNTVDYRPQANNSSHFKSAVLFSNLMHEYFQKNILSLLDRIYRHKPFTLELTFRASMNNFEAEKFHHLTHGIERTILLAKTRQNKIFGAYTSCAWLKDVMYEYQADEKMCSFLFMITQPPQEKQQEDSAKRDKDGQAPKKQKSKSNKKSSIQHKVFKLIKKQHAIMNHSACGPVFGQGHDLYITDQCHKNDNWANLGKSYQSEYAFGSIKANMQLAGAAKFFITEYEIWRLVY